MKALIARQLKAAMKRRRLNQSEREPRASTLCALADTLNVSADWLLGRRGG